MDELLHQLFDYQRFEGNPRLSALIEDTRQRCSLDRFKLEDGQLELNAAGDPDSMRQVRNPDEP